MAAIRDPAFWRRFSIAIHQDEEVARSKTPVATRLQRPELKPTDSWLERNRRKNRRTRTVGWIIALSLLLTVAGTVVVVLWFLKAGPFVRTTISQS